MMEPWRSLLFVSGDGDKTKAAIGAAVDRVQSAANDVIQEAKSIARTS